MKKFVIGAMLLGCSGVVWAATSNCASGPSAAGSGCADVDSTFSNSSDIIAVGNDGPNLVVNGGFETGDLTGWTLGNSVADGVCAVGTSLDGTTCPTNSGNYAMSFGNPFGASTLSQTLVTTAGDTYDVDFYLANYNPSDVDPTTFQVMWGGNVVYSLVSPQPSFPFTLVSLSFTATASSTTLEFLAQNGPGAWFLDDVSADDATIPEPSTVFLVGFGVLAAGLVRLGRRKSAQRI